METKSRPLLRLLPNQRHLFHPLHHNMKKHHHTFILWKPKLYLQKMLIPRRRRRLRTPHTPPYRYTPSPRIVPGRMYRLRHRYPVCLQSFPQRLASEGTRVAWGGGDTSAFPCFLFAAYIGIAHNAYYYSHHIMAVDSYCVPFASHVHIT